MPTKEEPKEYLSTTTADLKLISDYAHMPFMDVLELDVITYRILFKDAFIHMMSETEEGRDYLEQAWCLTQIKPDRESLRKQFE